MIILLTILTLFQSDCLEMDIMLLIDISASTKGQEEFIYNATAEFMRKFEPQKSVRIGVMVFNNFYNVIQPLTSDVNKLRSAAFDISENQGAGGTNMTLYMAGIELSQDRPNVHKVIILISDGAPNSKNSALRASEKVKGRGILLCGVFVENSEYSDNKFMSMACEPACYMVTNYMMLSEQLSQLDLCL